jgi:hypothetical protein
MYFSVFEVYLRNSGIAYGTAKRNIGSTWTIIPRAAMMRRANA